VQHELGKLGVRQLGEELVSGRRQVVNGRRHATHILAGHSSSALLGRRRMYASYDVHNRLTIGDREQHIGKASE
jgi:hypothetical protein